MPSIEGVDDDVPSKGYGVYGESRRGNFAVYGVSDNGEAVVGKSLHARGVHGSSSDHDGVFGQSSSGNGVYGISDKGPGVRGFGRFLGLDGESEIGDGVVGNSKDHDGVYGQSLNGNGVDGNTLNGIGVYGSSFTGTGLYATSDYGYAAYLDGRVYIRGPLQKPGGQFKIDHPLDPANKYLCHSFVESPDMKNIYDGVVALDDKGEAIIRLPDWFGALNKDFRYQLTAIGAPGPNLYIAEEIIDGGTNYNTDNSNYSGSSNNRFKIAGGNPSMKVSWHVTGIRKDPWANAHRIQVEEDKSDKERGYYMYPNLYGHPAENGIRHLLFPEPRRERLINENKPT